MSDFEQFSSLSNQYIQYPIAFNSRAAQHFPTQFHDSPNHSNSSPSSEFVAGPTKRVRHAQQRYTESSIQPDDISHLVRRPEKVSIPELSRYAEYMRALALTKHQKAQVEQSKSFTQKEEPQALNFGDELTIPALNRFGPFLTDPRLRIPRTQEPIPAKLHHVYHRMLDQLEQEEAEYVLRQRLLMHLERKQQRLENLAQSFPSQIALQRMQEVQSLKKLGKDAAIAHFVKPELQLNSLEGENQSKGMGSGKNSNLTIKFPTYPDFKLNLIKEEANMEELNTSSTVAQSKIEEEEENNGYYQYVKVEDTEEKGSDESPNEYMAYQELAVKQDKPEEGQIVQKQVKRESKKKKSQGYWNEYTKMLGTNLISKTKEEPRTKNKWQCKTEKGQLQVLQAEEPTVMQRVVSEVKPSEKLVEQKVRKARAPKQAKPVEVPQYLQEDKEFDFNLLMYASITNEAIAVGPHRPSLGFVMLNKQSEGIKCGETRVGNKYQANVPEFKGPVAGKRRYPRAMWRPEIVKEEDVKSYLEDLCNILGCDTINQERALQLLKRKKYRKERVEVNISKSKKFYVGFLGGMTLNNDIKIDAL